VLDKLKKNNRLNEALFLALLSMFCFSLWVFRLVYSHTSAYFFLNWNLFLAFIPWLFSSLMIINENLRKKKIIIVLLLLSWLVFFPNAPYVLTDLIHLKNYRSMPEWFDLMLILCFAFTALVFGFLSFWDIENLLSKRISSDLIPIISSLLMFLIAFGVYMGRYLRWNTWDILRNPYEMAEDIGLRIIKPFDYPQAWGMTIFMGLFLNIMYWSFRFLKKRD